MLLFTKQVYRIFNVLKNKYYLINLEVRIDDNACE